MTPEQILQINEQMAKICRKDYRIHNGIVWIDFGEDGDIITESWKPHYDWNHLMEVYNACLGLRTKLDKNEAWVNAECTNEELKALAALRSFLLSNEHYYAVIADSYKKLSEFITWHNKQPDEYKLPAPGTQSPSGSIPDTRR